MFVWDFVRVSGSKPVVVKIVGVLSKGGFLHQRLEVDWVTSAKWQNEVG